MQRNVDEKWICGRGWRQMARIKNPYRCNPCLSVKSVAKKVMRIPLLLSIFLLAGCVGGAGRNVNIAYYDLGASARIETGAQSLALRNVEVQAPSWLDAASLQYRLAYANAARRQSYAESRWVAAPAELIEQALRKAIISGNDAAPGGGCKLRVDLDEFVHLFDAPNASRGLLEARAALLAPRSDVALARHNFALSKPAPTPDAPGGIEALRGAVTELAVSLRDWLNGLDRGTGSGLNIAERCRGA